MSARKLPTVQDAATARQVLLDGLEHDVGIAEILNRLAPLHPRNDTFPGEVLTGLAAEALAWCRRSGSSRRAGRFPGAVPARL